MIILVLATILALVVLGILLHRLRREVKATRRGLAREIREHFRQTESLLALYRDLDPAHGLPPTRGFRASPDLLHLLVRDVADRGPRRILECGSGVSTVVLAEALRRRGEEGHVFALEHESRFAEETRSLLRERNLQERATVVDAPLVPVTVPGGSWRWYDPDRLPEGPFDLLVVDGPPGSEGPLARFPALPILAERLAPDHRIVVDDMIRSDEEAMVERWLRDHPRYRVERPDCESGCAVLSLR